MRVWKSPVFYFGVVLVLIVFSALLAPFVVDWGSYRQDLQASGEKLTGRKVEIAGPIGVRLFPWPRLTAQNVRVANEPGFDSEWFAAADQVVIRMSLGSLLNGTIQVETIDIEQPTVILHRLANGKNNWSLNPSEDFRNSRLLEHVMLDQITVKGGSLRMIDDRRASHTDILNINAIFSAPNLAGPWRSSGAFNYGELPLTFSASTGAWAEPLRLGLRVSSQENSGYSYILDGESKHEKFTGSLRFEPAPSVEGKGDTEGQFRLVKFKSKIAASFDAIDLTDIEIRPVDVSDQGTLLAGSANFTLGKVIQASTSLTAPRVDFDALAGAGSRRLLRDGGGLALVNGLLGSLPAGVDLRSSIKVAALRAGGEILENVYLDVSANPQAIRIHELSASLPGRSRTKFKGVFFPGAQYAELGGDLAIETQDARLLSLWLWPESKADITKTWTGARGRLKAKSTVALTASKLELQGIEYELNGEGGKANLSMLVNGERPIINLSVDAKTADIDSFVPNGFAALSSQGGNSWALVFANFIDDQVKRDMRLTLQAETMRLNGVEAKNLVVDVETTVKGFDLKTLELGLADGAKMSASGVVLSTSNGPDGEIGIAVSADDPRALLRLGGFLPREKDPAWSGVLGKTNLKIVLQSKPSEVEPVTGFSISGNTGDLTILSEGGLAMAVGSPSIGIKGSLDVASNSSATLLKLFGNADAPPDAIPARLVLKAEGTLNDGFRIDVKGEAYKAQGQFLGKLNPFAANFGLKGELSIQSADAKDLLGALGVPTVAPLAGQLGVKSEIGATENMVAFENVDGKLAGIAFSGAGSIEKNMKLNADFMVDRASLANLVAPVFLPWNGRPPAMDRLFAQQLPFGLMAEIWVRPKLLTVYPGLDVADAQVGLTANTEGTNFVAYAKTAEGQKVAVEIATKEMLDGQKVTGTFAMPVDLARHLMLVDGKSVASGEARFDVKFEGEGRSPGGALATLDGNGSFALIDGKLLNLTPANFSTNVVGAKDAAGLQEAFLSLHKGAGIYLNSVFGSLRIENGVATVAPIAARDKDADVTIEPTFELAEGQFDMGITLKLKALPNLPSMEISYAGPPSQLIAFEDTSALASYLGFKVLEQGVGELEKVQAEQRRLLVEEEQLRKADQEKLDAYYAQRAELRLRQRELRVHAAQRALDADLAVAEMARLIKEGVEINRAELRQRLRELRLYRKQVTEAAVPRSVSKPKVKLPVPEQQTQVPLILVPPADL